MRNIILGLALLFAAQNSHAEIKFVKTSPGCELRVVVENPKIKMKVGSDVLFFTGFGDRADNHAPLFRSLANRGARVISFDYPSHGESKCGTLNTKNFEELFEDIENIERATRVDQSRPLFVTGWSTGGLLALRMVQKKRLAEREIAGLVMLAPGISVHKFVGGDGIVRTSTLTSHPNPPHQGRIKPLSPFLVPIFAAKIASNAFFSRQTTLNVPTLLIVAGDDEDLYVKSRDIKDWYYKNQSSNLTGYQCKGAKHEIDNEIEPIGSETRALFTEFVANKNTSSVYGLICRVL